MATTRVYTRVPVEVRFWAMVTTHPSGCWLWTGTKAHGYGYFTERPGGFHYRAHRWAYEYLIGPIPSHLQIDHLCRVRHCVNPLHMEPVTAQVNQHRSNSVSGISARKTHCLRGHPFTPENDRIKGTRRVGCVCCNAEKVHRRVCL